jgi:hypothetical protein
MLVAHSIGGRFKNANTLALANSTVLGNDIWLPPRNIVTTDSLVKEEDLE